METHIETLKSLARLKSFQPSQLAQAQSTAIALENLFEARVVDGTHGEAPKIQFVAGELQRILQVCNVQKTPTLDEEMVLALKTEIARLRLLSQKAALVPEKSATVATTNGHLNSGDVEMMAVGAVTPMVAAEEAADADRPPPPPEAAWSDNDSMDSEEAYELAMRAERKKQMGPAARFLNLATLLSLSILILACVGVGYVSHHEFDTYQENEHKSLLYTLANIVSDGLTVIEASSSTSKVFLAEKFVNDLRELRLSSTANRFEIDASEPFVDIYARQMQYSAQTNELLFAANVSRTGELLCLSSDSMSVIQQNDLDYAMVEPMTYLEARGCTAEPGGPIWRNTASVRATYQSNRLTYRGVYARQVSKIWPALNLGFVVGTERDSFQQTIANRRMSLVGPHTPLAEEWQRWSALWISIGIAVTLLLLIVIAELVSWSVHEEHLMPAWAAVAHVVLNGVVVVAMTAVASSIFWYYLREDLQQLQEQHTRVVSRITAAALTSPHLLIALNAATPTALVTQLTTSALQGQFVYAQGSTTTPSALQGLADTVGARSLLSTRNAFLGGTKQSGATRFTFGAFFLAQFSTVSAVIRSSKVTVTLLDAGAYCGGIIMGAFGAQLLFGALFYYFTPLLGLLEYASGGVFLQKRFQPWQYRQVYYVFLASVSFATCLALAFFAVHSMQDQMNEVSATFTDKSVVEAMATNSLTQVDLNNLNMPSFAETILFQLNPSADPVYGMPRLMGGQTLRLPVPRESGWEKQNYASSISLSNISMTLMAPSYSTPLASIYSRSIFSSKVHWKRVTTTTIEPLVGVALERDPASSDLIWKDYQVYVSFVAASVLSTALVCLFLEFCYRAIANEYDPENDYGDSTGRTWRWVMFLTLLLSASSVLIGAGAASRAMKFSYTDFADSELTWAVAAAKAVVEGRATTASLSGDAAIVPALIAMVNQMNARTKWGMRAWSRWILLQETAPLDGSLQKVVVVSGGDTSTAVSLPNLAAAMDAPVTGVAPASVFFSTNANSMRYAVVNVNTFLAQTTTPQPLYFLALAADTDQMEGSFAFILTDLYRVCGAVASVLFLLFTVTLWFMLDAAEEAVFVVFDVSISLQGVAEESESAPPTLPRETRLWHTIVYVVLAVVLVFFCVSTLYGSAAVSQGINQLSVLEKESAQLAFLSREVVQTAMDFAITGFTTMRQTFNSALSSSSMASLWSNAQTFQYLNSTSGALVYQSFVNVSTGMTTFTAAVPTTFFADEMVSNYFQSYHDATMQTKDSLNEDVLIVKPLTDLLVMLESYLQQTEADLNAHSGSTLSSPYFNQTAMLLTMINCAEAKELTLAILTFEKVAMNTLLDFRQEAQSDSHLFELSANASVYLPLATQVHTALVNALQIAIANATTNIPYALAFDATWRDEAEAILSSVAVGLQEADMLSNLALTTVWQWQGPRLSELASELYGDSALVAAATTPLIQVLKTAQEVITTAVQGEGQSRLQNDGINTADWKRSLYTLSQNLSLLRALDDVFVTAIAVSLVALLIVLLVYAAVSYLVTHALIQHNATQLTNAAAEPDQGSSDSDDSSLLAAGERHHQAHTRRLVVSIAVVLIICIPMGMMCWVARQGVDGAKSLSITADRAHRAARYLQQLDSASDDVIFAASNYYIGGPNEIQNSLDNFLNLFRQLEFLLRNGFWQEDRQFVMSGNTNVAPLDGPLYRAYVLRNELDSIRAILLSSIDSMTQELAKFSALQSTTTANFSAAFLPLQKIANNMFVNLRQVSGAAAWKDVLLPLSGFTANTSSAIGQQVRASIEDCRQSVANSDPNATVVPKLHSLQKLLNQAAGVVEAEFLLWWFQTIGSNRNTTSSTAQFLQFAQLVNQSNLGEYNAASKAEAENRFASPRDMLEPLQDALNLFSGTSLMTGYTSSNLSAPSEWLTAAGACSTYFKSTTTTADFRALYAVNRDVIPTNERYPVSFSERITALRSAMQTLVDTTALSRLRMTTAEVAMDQTSAYRLSFVESVAFSLGNPEYVHTAIQWAAIVSFWVLFGSFLYFVVDLRLFST